MLADFADERGGVPFMHEHEVDAIECLVQIERREVVPRRIEVWINFTCACEDFGAEVGDEILNGPRVLRLERAHTMSAERELCHDTAEKWRDFVVPVGENRMAKKGYSHVCGLSA